MDPNVYLRLTRFVSLLMALAKTYSHHEVAIINNDGEMTWGASFWANKSLALEMVKKFPSRSPYMAAAKRGVLQLLVLLRPWLTILVTPMLRTKLEGLCPWAGGVGTRVSKDHNLAMTTSRFAAIVDRLISALMHLFHNPLDLNLPGLEVVGVMVGVKPGTVVSAYEHAAREAGVFFTTFDWTGRGVAIVWQLAPGKGGQAKKVEASIAEMTKRKFAPAPWNPGQNALIVKNTKPVDGIGAMGVVII